MSGNISPRALDPEGAPDGAYVLTVSGGHVIGLTASSGSGGAGSSSSGEALVADGTTPPEALTTEAGDDWLYQG